MLKSLGGQRLVALFCVGWALLSFPLLALWNHDTTVWGLPLLPTALFAIWGLLIAAMGWLVERSGD